MKNYNLRESTLSDAEYIAEHMRDLDRAELDAVGTTPKESLVAGLERSSICITALVDNHPAVMFGVAQFDDGAGHPWMLCTDDIDLVSFSLVREAKRWIRLMLEVYPILTNYVHSENDSAIRFIKMMGFEFPEDGEVIVPETGEAFLRFEKYRG